MIILFSKKTLEACIGNIQKETCSECSSDSYLLNDLFSLDLINSTNDCSLKNLSDVLYNKTYYVSNISCSSAGQCLGTLTFPFDSLIMALNQIHSIDLAGKFQSQIIQIYLIGSPHYIMDSDILYSGTKYFRRMNANISLSPWFCEDAIVLGCVYKSQGQRVDIIIKTFGFNFEIYNEFNIANINLYGNDIILGKNTALSCYNNKSICCDEGSMSHLYSQDECGLESLTINITSQNKLMKFKSLFQLRLLYNENMTLNASIIETPIPTLNLVNITVNNFYSISNDSDVWLSFISFGSLGYIININNVVFRKNFFPMGILYFLVLEQDPYYDYLIPTAITAIYLKYPFSNIYASMIFIDSLIISEYFTYEFIISGTLASGLITLYDQMTPNVSYQLKNLIIHNNTLSSSVYFLSYTSKLTNQVISFYLEKLLFQNNTLISLIQTSSSNITFNRLIVENVMVNMVFFSFDVGGFIWFFDSNFFNLQLTNGFFIATNYVVMLTNISFERMQNCFTFIMTNGNLNMTHWKFFFANITNSIIFSMTGTNVSISDSKMFNNSQGPDPSSKLYTFYMVKTVLPLFFNSLNLTFENWVFLNTRYNFLYMMNKNISIFCYNGLIQNLKFNVNSQSQRLYFFNLIYVEIFDAIFQNFSFYNNEALTLFLEEFNFQRFIISDFILVNNTCNYYHMIFYLGVVQLEGFEWSVTFKNLTIINLHYPYRTYWLMFFFVAAPSFQDVYIKNISHNDFYSNHYMTQYQEEQIMILLEIVYATTIINSYFESSVECNYNIMFYLISYLDIMVTNSTFVSIPNLNLVKFSKAFWMEVNYIYGVDFNMSDCIFYNFTLFYDLYIDWECHAGVLMLVGPGNVFLNNIYFYGNTADYYGVITLSSFTIAEIYNVTIINSKTFEGGGITITGFTVLNSFVKLDTVMIYQSDTQGNGGGIFIDNVMAIEINNIILANISANYGGAMSFQDVSNATLTNLYIKNASANEYGGAFYLFRCSNLNISFSTIENTQSLYGGAIYSDSSSMILSNTMISSTMARISGGAFYLKSVQELQILIKINNSLITSSYAVLSGSGLIGSQLQFLQISNTQFVSNWADVLANVGIIQLSSYFANISDFNINQNIFEKVQCLNNSAQVSCFYLSTNLKITLRNCLAFQLSGSVLFVESDGLSHVWQTIELTNFSAYQSNSFNNEFRNLSSNALITIINAYHVNISNFKLENNSHFLNLFEIKYSDVYISNSIFSDYNSLSLRPELNVYLLLLVSNVELTNISIYYSQNYSLTQSGILKVTDSSMILNDSLFTNCEIDYSRLLYFEASDPMTIFLIFNTSFNKLGSNNAIIEIDSSNLVISNCNFSSNINLVTAKTWDDKTIDIYFSDKTNTKNLTIFGTYFENQGGANSVSIIGGLFIQITSSQFLSTKPQEFSNCGLYVDTVSNVFINSTEFKYFGSETGAAIKLYKLNFKVPLIINVFITQCSFFNNTAYLGGTIFLRGFIVLKVLSCKFVGNIAKYSSSYIGNSGIGGCLVSDSEYYNSAELILKDSIFINNYAEKYAPNFLVKNNASDMTSGNKFINNSDALNFSEEVTSLPFNYFLLSSNFTIDCLNDQSLKSMNNAEKTKYITQKFGVDTFIVASGQPFNFSIIMTDAYNQTLFFESTSYAKMSCALNSQDVLISKETSTVVNGIFTFINVTITCLPNVNLECSIRISSGDSILITSTKDPIINTTLNRNVEITLPVFVRKCIKGEVKMVDNTCRICSSQTFSLINPLNATCLPCPKNAICMGGSDLRPAKGNWRYSINSSLVLNCPTPEACLGFINNDDSSIITGKCSDQYWGNLCYSCQTGLGRSEDDGVCQPCTQIVWAYVKIVLGFIFIILYTYLQVTVYSKINDIETPAAILLKMFLNHFQILAMISLVNFHWTSDFQIYFNLQEYFSCLYQNFFSIDCFIQSINQNLLSEKIIFEILLPILFSLILLIIWIGVFLHKLIHDPENFNKNGYFTEKIRTTFIVLIFIFYPEILRKCFILLNCIVIDDFDNFSVLRYSPEMVCWGSDHLLWALTISLPGILIWGILTPVAIYYILYRNQTEIKTYMDTQSKKYIDNSSNFIIKSSIVIDVDPIMKEKLFGESELPLTNSIQYKIMNQIIIENIEINLKTQEEIIEEVKEKPLVDLENIKKLIKNSNLSEDFFKNEKNTIDDPEVLFSYLQNHKNIIFQNDLKKSDLVPNSIYIKKSFEVSTDLNEMTKNKARESIKKRSTSKFLTRKVTKGSVSIFKNLGFIYKGYKTEYYYWEIVLFSRKFFLIMIGVFKEIFPAQTQNSNILLVLFFYYYIQNNNNPYAFSYLNRIETLTLKISLITAFIGILLFVDAVQQASLFFLILIILLNTYFLGLWFHYLLKYGNLKEKLKKFIKRFKRDK